MNARIRTLVAASMALVAASCARDDAPVFEAAGAVEVDGGAPACAPRAGAPLRVDTLVTGLEVPWDVAFLPDGRALVTERPGRIRVVEADGTLRPEPWAELDVYAMQEVGLMGVDAVAGPDGTDVYVSATVRRTGGNVVVRMTRGIMRRIVRALDPERGHPTTLQVLRLRDAGGRAGTPDVVVEGIPSFMIHGGGALRVGADGALYLTNGDGAAHHVAQDPASRRGKILRYALDGSVPADNPTTDSPVYALGIRHVQGLAWHPERGRLLAVDHGPSGMASEGNRTDRDELNVVGPGENLGWPIVAGATEGGPWTSPIVTWTPAIAPAGLAVYTGDSGPWSGSAFVTGLRGTSLRRLDLEETDAGLRVVCEETLLPTSFGRLRLVRQAPDGTLWVGTSNRDGRGVPRDRDDMILRIHPPVA